MFFSESSIFLKKTPNSTSNLTSKCPVFLQKWLDTKEWSVTRWARSSKIWIKSSRLVSWSVMILCFVIGTDVCSFVQPPNCRKRLQSLQKMLQILWSIEWIWRKNVKGVEVQKFFPIERKNWGRATPKMKFLLKFLALPEGGAVGNSCKNCRNSIFRTFEIFNSKFTAGSLLKIFGHFSAIFAEISDPPPPLEEPKI